MTRKLPLALFLLSVIYSSVLVAQFGRAADPGVRLGPPGAGGPLPGLSANQAAFFEAGRDEFQKRLTVPDGLGPTMNLDNCTSCHSEPAIGGSSPAINPEVAFANAQGAINVVPPFITLDGPAREARFITAPDGGPDGGVHNLFTITGRADAPGCAVAQPDFASALERHNVSFRIPTPTFGLGLVEAIPDRIVLATASANADQKRAFGIHGRANVESAGRTVTGEANTSNDGTVTRFGWKAQNKSLLIFSGEAYNVEMGVSNEMFPTERNETPGCHWLAAPNDITRMDATTMVDVSSDIERFATFMRFLAPPEPSTTTPGGPASIAHGRDLFAQTGCALCHTPGMTTGHAHVAALSEQPVNLYSDLLVHDMGPGLADGVTQGQAGPQEFRTAPLWGLGQRRFFLHDGRTSDLLVAILAHRSGGSHDRSASEADAIISRFMYLNERDKQDLLNFLRSL